MRYHRAFGYDTYFLTGSDEHGQKVASSAAALNRLPQEHCDEYVRSFKVRDAMTFSCGSAVIAVELWLLFLQLL